MKQPPIIELLVKDLRPALTGLAKVIATKPTSPVLGCVRIETTTPNNLVTLTGTDLDTRLAISLSAVVRAHGDPVLIPLADLRDATKGGSANDSLILQPGDDDRLTLIRDTGTTRIPHTVATLPVADFPEATEVKAKRFDLDDHAHKALMQAMACASSDPTRQVLNGAFIEGGHSVVGTDGRHLYRCNSMELPIRDSVILPHHKVLDWKPLHDTGKWTLALDDDWFQLAGEHWSLSGRLVEGNFPNWKQVMPPDRDFRSSVTFPEDTLAQLISTITSLPGGKSADKPVGLRMNRDGVTLLTRGDDGDAQMSEVPLAESVTSGPAATVFVNRDYLLKALRFGLNRVDIIDAMSPLRLRQGTSSNRDMIIMPIRVTDATTPVPKPQPQPTPMKNNSNNEGGNGRHQSDPNEETTPLDSAATHILNAKAFLRQAVSELTELGTALKQAKADQKTTEKEFRQVRSTIRSLQKVEL